MATSNTSSHLLRRLGASQSPAFALQQSRAFQTAQRHLHTPTPLQLDFLAPSWSSAERKPTSRSLRTNTVRMAVPQRRWMSLTTRRGAKALTNPRQDEEGKEMSINITPRAAHRLQAIAKKDGNPDLALRVSVESGGCHGFQYLMSLVNASEIDASEDTLFEDEGSTKDTGTEYRAKVVMDEPSLELLKGSSVDYTMELIGSQFKVTGIPGAKSSCGCGTSFDIAA